VYPPALPAFVSVSGLERFMLDQDTGGAIRAAGRADIYMGIGPDAGQLAGHQFAEGKMYYLLLKPERVQEWLQKNYQMK
jgi:membrane-bound lytic murein transglycosylase A